MNDYSLIGRGAQEIAAMSRLLNWDQVIDVAFGVDDPVERRTFRVIAGSVSKNANRIASAAEREDKLAIVLSAGAMWTDGCIACHERFR